MVLLDKLQQCRGFHKAAKFFYEIMKLASLNYSNNQQPFVSRRGSLTKFVDCTPPLLSAYPGTTDAPNSVQAEAK